jgi:hypothetical protein
MISSTPSSTCRGQTRAPATQSPSGPSRTARRFPRTLTASGERRRQYDRSAGQPTTPNPDTSTDTGWRMSTPAWAPGTQYPPGSIVQPASAIAPVAATVVNGTSKAATPAGRRTPAGLSVNTAPARTFRVRGRRNGTRPAPGRIKCDRRFRRAAGPVHHRELHKSSRARRRPAKAGARVEIGWYTSGDVLISYSSGNLVDSTSSQHWKQSTVTAAAPVERREGAHRRLCVPRLRRQQDCGSTTSLESADHGAAGRSRVQSDAGKYRHVGLERARLAGRARPAPWSTTR